MSARTGQHLDIEEVRKTVQEIVEDMLGERSLLYNLTSLKGMGWVHLRPRSQHLRAGRGIGEANSPARDELDTLVTATLLHDVGRILVPVEILRKPGPLDEAEFRLMSRHPVEGAVMLSTNRSSPRRRQWSRTSPHAVRLQRLSRPRNPGRCTSTA